MLLILSLKTLDNVRVIFLTIRVILHAARTMLTFFQYIHVCLFVFNAIFINNLAISWRSVLLVEVTGVPVENQRPVAIHWQTLSHNFVSNTPRHERGSKPTTLLVIDTDGIGSYESIYHTITTTTSPRNEMHRYLYCIYHNISYWIIYQKPLWRGRDRMVVRCTTTWAVSAYHHWCCEFESPPGRGVQHYVIKFVTDLRPVGCFLRVLRLLPPLKLVYMI